MPILVITFKSGASKHASCAWQSPIAIEIRNLHKCIDARKFVCDVGPISKTCVSVLLEKLIDEDKAKKNAKKTLENHNKISLVVMQLVASTTKKQHIT